MKYLSSLLILLCLGWHTTAAAEANPQVQFETSHGNFVIELYPDQAPQTVENFLRYVRDEFYNGTLFHRVIPDFVVQAGGYTAAYRKKDTYPPIRNEADNGLKNTFGTVAAARSKGAHSVTSQFFINMGDNDMLDHTGTDSDKAWGYAVFGKVVQGMETLENIQEIETGRGGPFRKYLPQQRVLIQDAVVVGEEPPAAAAPVDEEAAMPEKEEMAEEDYVDEEDMGDEEATVEEDMGDEAMDEEDYADEEDMSEDMEEDTTDYADEEDMSEEDMAEDAADTEEAPPAAESEPAAKPAKTTPAATAAAKPDKARGRASMEPEPPDIPAVQ